ncbi:MAG: hypothetical protein JNM27_10695 [Leptospirales bacterium]|nr:hypothetical protein [Leptospirales bacterium]
MRPVITGIGLISPIGNGIVDFWENLLAGKCGIRDITRFDASSFPCRIAGQADFHAEDYLDRRFVRFTSLATQFACAAFVLARKDAGIQDFTPRADVIVGSGVSNLGPVMEQIEKTPQVLEGYLQTDPLLIQKMFIGGPASGIALLAGANGFVTTVSTACSSGINAVGLAADRIRHGKSDIVIAAACDAPLNHLVHTGFCSSGHYTNVNDPAAQKPFDVNREKCAPGEGATVFILEDHRRARARGARIYCEIADFDAINENTSELYFLDKTATRWGSLIGRMARGVNHVNTHGISDRVVDHVESTAIKKGFGRRARRVTITSIKGAVGSGLAAAGGFQIASAAKTIETGIGPPTLHYSSEDPDISLNVLTRPTKIDPQMVLINSHGVTGYNSALKLRRFRL